MMRKLAKICGAMLVLALLGALWWLFIDSAPPPRRPDLVRVPAELGPPPKGFPTENALLAAFGLSSIGLMDLDLVDMDASAPEVEGVAVRRDIVYGTGGDTELQLDLYTPEGLSEPAPGLIFIHGGGWRSGKRQDYALYTSRFARHGYVVATVSYRLREAGYFPNSVEDVKAAVRWMRANAAEINVDPDRIAAIGGSAGGHLAMMLGYTSDVPELEGSGGNPGVSSAVQAVVNIYGPVDFSVYPERDHRLVTTYLQGRYEERTEIYELASPITHVDPSDPPTLIIHGTLDTLVPVTQSDLLAEKFQELGMAYWYDRIDGWPHAMDVANPVNARVEQVAVAFLQEVFETAAPER